MAISAEITRHLRVYSKLIKFAAIEETTYRFSFFLEWFVEAGYMMVSLLLLRVLFWNVQEVAGWNFSQMLVLIGLSLIFSETILGLAFIFNLRNLPSKVVTGELDLILTKPINSQFAVSLWRPYFAFIPSLVPGLASIFYGFRLGNFYFDPLSIPAFLVIFVSGLVIAYSIGMIISTLTLWFVYTEPLPELAEEILFMASRPYSIFTGIWKIVFLVIFPLAFMVTFPAKALMGDTSWWWLPMAILLATLFLWLSNFFWKAGLRHYQSASS
jgi:ABC-2 type transport system permease protein